MKTLLFIIIVLYGAIGNINKQQTENLSFNNFAVNISQFVSAYPPHSTKPFRNDTIVIYENACDQEGWYIDKATLEIIPRVKADSFSISIAYENSIWEVDRYSKSKPSTQHERFTYVTEYKTIAPISKNKFKMQKRWMIDDRYHARAIEKKYELRDTLITGDTEGGPFLYRFTKNGKVFDDNWSTLYFRIKKFNNGMLKETKYILVGLEDACD